jgi:dipeptidyl aminopeptidase/acylaminoacyl peptidase
MDISRAGRLGQLLCPNSLPFAYQTQRLLCEAPYGGGEATEVARAIDRMSEDDFDSWYAGWRWLAEQARADADKAAKANRKVTARERFFAAANYYRTAEFFLAPDDERKNETWHQMVDAFTRAGALWDPPFEEIRWPYEGHSLPGYLVKPAGASGRLPTVVYLNGADGTKEESWYLGGKPLVDRGVNFVGIEGPGQGEPLRLHKLYTRPDYEAVTAPLLDQLVERDDVDPDRIGLIGISMGGYYASRIAAYEPRFRCVAVHGTCFNIHDDLYENFEPIRPQLQWITGTFDDAKARAVLREFDLRDHLPRVKGPIYVSHGADDVLVRPKAAENTVEHLTAADKTVHIWTDDNPLGGAIHCSLDNPTQAYPEIADWMVEQLRS